jgi:hypothetical protein
MMPSECASLYRRKRNFGGRRYSYKELGNTVSPMPSPCMSCSKDAYNDITIRLETTSEFSPTMVETYLVEITEADLNAIVARLDRFKNNGIAD